MPKYKVEGYFEIELDADDARDVRAKAQRILLADGIGHNIVNVEAEKDEKKKRQS